MSLTDTPDIHVNGALIAAAQIDAEMQYHPAESRRKAMVEAAETLIIGELLKQRAVQQGLFPVEKSLTEDEEQSIFGQLIAAESPSPTITDEECQRYYQANPSSFTSTPLIEVRHILLAADPAEIDERATTEQLAQQLIEQIKSGELSFEEAVRLHSACPSAKTGGQLGQLSKGQTVPEFERQVFAADEGLMARPIESRYGFHIVEVTRKIEGELLPFEFVSDKISTYLNEKAKRKATAQYISVLISEADIDGYYFDIDASPLLQ